MTFKLLNSEEDNVSLTEIIKRFRNLDFKYSGSFLFINSIYVKDFHHVLYFLCFQKDTQDCIW